MGSDQSADAEARIVNQLETLIEGSLETLKKTESNAPAAPAARAPSGTAPPSASTAQPAASTAPESVPPTARAAASAGSSGENAASAPVPPPRDLALQAAQALSDRLAEVAASPQPAPTFKKTETVTVHNVPKPPAGGGT